VVVIINVLWEGSAFIRQASMVRHSGTRYSNRSMEDLILSDASAGEDADTGEEYNMCESLCDGGALNTTVESPLICYSFWWFYYEEEKDDYNIMYNPSPYSTANCLKAMEYSHFKLMEIACSVCSGSTDSISPKKTSKSPPPPPTDDVGSYRLPPAASESWALKSPEQLSPIITRLASPLSPKRGRGVVYTGDGAHMRLILVSVRMLREHNVDIPVEVFVPESALGYCRNIPWGSNNVKCRATPPLHKYVNKLYAILASSFEEVLFMDADNFVLRDPERLFDAPEYKKTGAMFWPDLWGYACTHPTNLDQSRKDNMKHPKSMRHEIRNLCGQSTWPDHGMWRSQHLQIRSTKNTETTCGCSKYNYMHSLSFARYTGVQWKPEWKVVQEFESGQLIVNQTRHRAALMLTMFLATDTFAQNVLYGDKDCFK